MKAASWLQSDGHSRILKVSDCSESANLTRSGTGSVEAAAREMAVERGRFRNRNGGGLFQRRRVWASIMEGEPQPLDFLNFLFLSTINWWENRKLPAQTNYTDKF